MRTDWIRVTRQRLCKICGKPDWCSYSADGRVAVCMRTESDKAAKNGGYVHKLTDDDWKRLPPRAINRKEPKPAIDWDARQQRYTSQLTDSGCEHLANEIGLSIDVLRRFGTGWCCSRSCWTFPIRNHAGRIVGTRTRPMVGNKESDKHSHGNGMFFVPESLNRDYVLIVEGASDAMAIHDIGYRSVVGRSNCTGSVEEIVRLLRRLKPGQVVIIPDNDSHGAGQRGAEALQFILKQQHLVELLSLPDGINDVRDCIQQKESADWLRNRIGELISTDQHRKDSTNE